jgi:putative aminopeptidase FrvX
MKDLFVDIGAQDKADAETMVQIGDVCVYANDCFQLGANRVASPAMDDRAACALLIRFLQTVGATKQTIIAVFSVQEEVGCRGAKVASFAKAPDKGIAIDVTAWGDTPGTKQPDIKLEVGCRGAKGAAFQQEPDIGIVLEGTTCNDLGDVPETAHVCEAGQGVAVSFMDGASIANRALFRKALDVAKQENIPHQVKHSVSGGNDGGAIQRAREGVPVVVLSVPCRYIHSPSSVVKLSDVESQFALVKALVKAL